MEKADLSACSWGPATALGAMPFPAWLITSGLRCPVAVCCCTAPHPFTSALPPSQSRARQEAYLDVTLPVLGATLRALEAEHRQTAGEGDARLAKRLKYLGSRRRSGAGGDEPEGESGADRCAQAASRT
jgi:hypothetical protein